MYICGALGVRTCVILQVFMYDMWSCIVADYRSSGTYIWSMQIVNVLHHAKWIHFDILGSLLCITYSLRTIEYYAYRIYSNCKLIKIKFVTHPLNLLYFSVHFFYLIFARFLTFIQSIMIEFLIFISILAFLNSMMVFGSIAVNCYLPCIRVSTPLEDLLLPFTN